jgi:hypothetical protein
MSTQDKNHHTPNKEVEGNALSLAFEVNALSLAFEVIALGPYLPFHTRQSSEAILRARLWVHPLSQYQ